MDFVDGLVFDLDNTLLDRYSAFVGVAESFYEEHLRPAALVERDEAVAMMIRWDGDGYNDREGMLRRWLSEWPDIRLDMESLRTWYRAEIERQVKPDAEVNGFLAWLNERRVPWGIVTNGSPSQHGKCRAAGLDKLAGFHHRFRRGWLQETGPQDISRCAGGYGAREPRAGHVRRGQSAG